MISDLVLALGLAFSVGLFPHSLGPVPVSDTSRELPQSVTFVPDNVFTPLNALFNDGWLHYFDIDLTQSSWNATPSLAGDSFSVDGCTYLLWSASFDWSYIDVDGDPFATSFVLNSIRVAQFFTSQDEFLQAYYPTGFVWSSWFSGQSINIQEGNSNVFEGLQPIAPAYNWRDSYSWNGGAFMALHSAQAMSGASPSYQMPTVNFQTFRSRVASIVYAHAMSGFTAYQNGWSAGDKHGYSEGKRDGENIGYQKGLDATGNNALAGSLFGSIIAIPFDVLNGLNEFMIWGIPIVSILITFLLVALIVAIIKRFV